MCTDNCFGFICKLSKIFCNHKLHFFVKCTYIVCWKRGTKINVAKVFLWMCDLKKIDKFIVYNFQRIVSKQLTIYSNQASFGFYSSCFFRKKKILIFVQEIYFLIKKYFCIPNREIGRLVLTFSKSTIFRNVCWIFNNLILAY